MARPRPQSPISSPFLPYIPPYYCQPFYGPPPILPRAESGRYMDTAHPSLAPMGGFVRRSSRLDGEASTSATAYRPRMTEPYEENEDERTSKARCEAQRQLAQMYSVTDPSRVVNDDQTMQGKSAQTSPSGRVTSPQQRPRTVPPMFPQAADIFAIPVVPNDPPADTRKNRLSDLPIEIQEHIIDYLAGPLGSAASTSASRNWNHAMRHPRRRQLTQLALVNPAWREMIQERVFRHLKIQGTYEGLNRVRAWFIKNAHLQRYVKHIECWVPVWEWRAPNIETTSATPRYEQINIGRENILTGHGADISMRDNFTSAPRRSPLRYHTTKASLFEIFACIRQNFPEAFAMTIEGGSCKRSIAVSHRPYHDRSHTLQLPVLPKVTTLVLKGAYNVMRNDQHYANLVQALPALRECYFVYAKPKREAYKNLCSSFGNFPPAVTHLNLCFDGLNAKNVHYTNEKWAVLLKQLNLCNALGGILPQLEHFAYSGRICGDLFKAATRAHMQAKMNGCVKEIHLKSIDLIVKSCCHLIPPNHLQISIDSATYRHEFISSFENLIISCIDFLAVFRTCRDVRIRYLDFDSPFPLVNPYFQIKNRKEVTGLWSERILDALRKSVPEASFDALEDLPEGVCAGVGGGGKKYRSISVQSYSPPLGGFL